MELFIQALQCTICMDDLFDPFGQHGEVQNTKCGHVFHADCLEASLQAYVFFKLELYICVILSKNYLD